MILALGCAPPKDDGGYVKISGTVHVDGSPTEGVVVKLHPESDQPALSSGVSGPGGTLVISTNELGDGALPGRYQVTCTWSDFDPVSRSWTGDRLNDRYASKADSGIVWEIVANETHDIGTLELSTTAKD